MAPPAAAAPASTASSSPSAAVPSSAEGPHPGTLDVFEPVPGGATTLDPAAAYDTTSYEVILNVYQTLVSYNGSTTGSFVPTLATCVPGQGTQCATDYGTGFTGIFNATGGNFTGTNGAPVYWTFVIDPAAHFYDPGTGTSWKVYPSDVMFSIARSLAFADVPYATKTAGWILAQALLPPGNDKWDNSLHSPYNNTPAQIYDSMLVNDSAYCPAKAMNGVQGNGCITFVADGSSQVWPEFLDFVEDNLGASVVPCGWFSAQGANITGWSGSAAAHGDGSCKLPDGGSTTNNSAWSTYVGGLGDTYWDTYEALDNNWPAPNQGVEKALVGSGPYYASVNWGLSYDLAANPGYAEPSGCSGAASLATYSGYCDPAPGAYIPKVDVTWETSKQGDSLGTDAIEAGTADFAGIYTTQTTSLLGYVHSGLWQYNLFPTLSTGFTPINLGISYSAFDTDFAGVSPSGSNPINATLLTDLGIRNFYVQAYPYTTIEEDINTVDDIQFSFNAGGPIPFGMGNYYPSNVSWPSLMGDPIGANATHVGSAQWWWNQLVNETTGPYYNATLVKDCVGASSPCSWYVGYFDGAPVGETVINDWAGEIYNISQHALEPVPLAETFTQFLTAFAGAYEVPLASSFGFGWAPDYPDPTDYAAPMSQANGDYTGPDAFSEQLLTGGGGPWNATNPSPYENNTTCGHSGIGPGSYGNLTYWANQANVTNLTTGNFSSECQGVAYAVANYWLGITGALAAGPTRILQYNLEEQILNRLAMYIYNGQTNELVGFAPWIDKTSINENPVIGGGGDSVWFQVRYNTSFSAGYSITMKESGLPSGTSWSATVGLTTLTGTGTSIAFPATFANGSYNYSVSFETGYSVAPSSGAVTVAGADATQDVVYTAFSTASSDVYFNETGLPSNTSWSVLIPGYGAVTSGEPTETFALPNHATYPYTASLVVGFLTPAAGERERGRRTGVHRPELHLDRRPELRADVHGERPAGRYELVGHDRPDRIRVHGRGLEREPHPLRAERHLLGADHLPVGLCFPSRARQGGRERRERDAPGRDQPDRDASGARRRVPGLDVPEHARLRVDRNPRTARHRGIPARRPPQAPRVPAGVVDAGREADGFPDR